MGIITTAAGAALALIAGWIVLATHHQPDFTVQWAAQHVANPYDSDRLRAEIGSFAELPQGRWPYPYPPTYTVLTRWFALLPFRVAYLVFVTLSGAALVVSSGARRLAPFTILSPWTVLAVMAGQTSVIVGALVFAGIEAESGVLLGLSACIKPQFVIFPAIGIAFGRHWRVLAHMTLTAAIVALSTVLLSPSAPVLPWIDWLHSVPQTAALSLTIHPHLDFATLPLKSAAAVVGLWLLWLARCDDADERAILATGVSLLVMPHSLWYNSAIMVPAIVAYAHRARIKALPTVAPLLLFPSSLLIVFASIWPPLKRLDIIMNSGAAVAAATRRIANAITDPN